MADRNQRRSMGDAMMASADKLAFIRGESAPLEVIPKTIVPKPVHVESHESSVSLEQPADKHLQNDDRQPVKAEKRTYRSKTNLRMESSQLSQNAYPNLLVPLTTRLKPSTAAALKRACLEQKLSGQHPSSVQEIAEIAIADWLNANGFLT